MSVFKYSGNASSWWLGNDFDSEFQDENNNIDLTKLASTQRAIANFVNIVTGQQIPVEFQSRGNSYTDGSSVVIGTKLDGKNFDPTVGLALHEGSHIAYTNFELLSNFSANVALYGVNPNFDMTLRTEKIIKDLLNWIEDRRIDYLIYKTAPGYRMYYESMYEKYFCDKIIDKALKDKRKCKETLDDYFFHIINFTNPNRDLTQLELLQEIWDIIDLKNISRLKSTTDALEVACTVYKRLAKHLEKNEESSDNNESSSENNTSTDGGESEGSGESGEGEGSKESIEVEGSGDDTDKNNSLSPRQQKMLDNAINKQRQFLNGEQKKSGRLTKAQSHTVKAIKEAGTEIVSVDLGGEKVDTIVIKKLTKNIINHMPEIFSSRSGNDHDHVMKGIRLGKMLGKKLQIRNEEKTLKSTRLQSGKIDRRLISQLGYDNSNVFHKIVTDRYKDYFIHISIDASGSMWGEKLRESITSAVAIAQAASMTSGIRVQISFRGTAEFGNSGGQSWQIRSKCVTVIAYDSAKDKMTKIKNLFGHIATFGMTPEGVAFKSIEKQIIQDTKGAECIFINYSDGYPTHMGNHGGQNPIGFTRNVIKQFRESGMGIISYFISNGSTDLARFKDMYGNDAENIDPENMFQVSRTMNSKFLEKSK